MTELINDLGALDAAHVLHPWDELGNTDHPLVIARGERCHLWDDSGNRYFDAVGGLWCTNIGLGRREMADAIAEQAMNLAFSSTFVDMTNAPMTLLAAKLAALAPPSLDHVHFTTGGSTAIDSAYRMAHFTQAALGHPERTHMIARHHSYHGSTHAAMSLGLRDGDRAPGFTHVTDTIHHIGAPYMYRRPDGMDAAAFTDHLIAEFEAKIEEIGADRIAAFFAEPIQASGGVLVPEDDYLKRMWQVCQDNGILFVADEVVTAYGRLGHWFASYGEYDVTPDLICCAKGLSSGYQPIGAVLFSDAVHKAITSQPWYTSGYTYSGHPVACAAALKNIEILEREEILPHVRDVGPYFQEQLVGLNDLAIVGDTRGRGLIGCVENVADKVTKRPLGDDLDIGRRISDAAEKRGLLVRPIGALNVMSPPLILKRQDVDFISENLRGAIVDVMDGLVREHVKIG